MILVHNGRASKFLNPTYLPARLLRSPSVPGAAGRYADRELKLSARLKVSRIEASEGLLLIGVPISEEESSSL